jgi:pimeloyl-ACP methyl ester carboxylesterase
LREGYRSDCFEMDLDIVSFPGSPEKPSVIFIHGLGMDKNIWVAPCKSRVLGGMFPLQILVSKCIPSDACDLQTLFHDLKDRHYSVITWSQQKVSSQIQAVVPELTAIVGIARGMSDAGIILIGHSRGGLIARKYLSKADKSIKCLITIATPHKGSALARMARYIAPLASLLGPLVAQGKGNNVSGALKRISEFLKSKALQELLPESTFFQTLHDGPQAGVSYISAGGTSPVLFTCSPFSFPLIFEKIIPENFFPEEMKNGKGDGLVSAESSKMPWAEEHFYFDCNHAEILFDKEARNTVINAIEQWDHKQ